MEMSTSFQAWKAKQDRTESWVDSPAWGRATELREDTKESLESGKV